MKKKNIKKIDWSKRRYRDMLIDQRKYLWCEDTISKLAKWIGFRAGMTVIDVGCGLGYLGFTYWQYYGRGGKYIGIDLSVKLLKDATRAAKQWAKQGGSFFVAGDAYKLPLPDDFADCVMCQTLLLQLRDPQQAVNEMVRVVKPGGVVVCQEPDNLAYPLNLNFTSLPELSIEEELLLRKFVFISYQGRIKLGLGDSNVGRKVAHMMHKAELVDIDIRLNDRVYFLEPPYDSPVQRYLLKMIKKRFRNDRRDRSFWLREAKENFLAGGGRISEYDRVKKISRKTWRVFKGQIKNRTYYDCSTGMLFVTKGRKPG